MNNLNNIKTTDIKRFFLNLRDKWRYASDNAKVFMICSIILAATITISLVTRYAPRKTEIEASPIPYVTASGVGEEIVLTFAGDIMCHDGQLLDAKTEDEKYDFSKCFTTIAPYIYKSDIATANLEGVIVSDEQGVYGYPYFFMPESLADEIANIGFDVVSLCNTQAYNADTYGLEHTSTYLKEKSIVSLKDKSTPIIKEKKGVKVGYIPYIDESYFNDTENKEILKENLNLLNYTNIKKDVKYCIDNKSDIIVAYVRWGKDAGSVPTTHMKDMAQYLVSSGVDIVIGTGSHTVMPMEVIETDYIEDLTQKRKGYVFYSLGNFVSNQRTGTSDMGALVNLTVRKISMDSTRVVDFDVVPIYTNVDIADGRNFQVVPAEKNSTAPVWMDETNKERFNKVYNLVDSIIYSFDTSERAQIKRAQ